jgi:solute carrier family 8 (sodium/calcium exchanger)
MANPWDDCGGGPAGFGLSFECSGHRDCCTGLFERSLYSQLDMCPFGSYNDFDFAVQCCTDAVMAAVGFLGDDGAPLTKLCYDRITGLMEPCEFSEPSICCPGGGGAFLPFGNAGRYEVEWPLGSRVIAYLVFLGWLFLGIATVSDIFMAAIEEITSKEREVEHVVDGQKRKIEVKVWNDTLANLSLMALGSSAPEILLSLLELLGRRYYFAPLGSSTIVGSAAFNLFVITAVCIVAIPVGEVRFIYQTTVYAVTLTFSLFAYLWVLIIVQLTSPEVVTVGEALATFAFLPLLLCVSYMADKGMWPFTCVIADAEEDGEEKDDDPAVQLFQRSMKSQHSPDVKEHFETIDDNLAREGLAKMVKHCADKYGERAEERAVQRIIKLQASTSQVKSRAYYRVQATRGFTAQKKVDVSHAENEELQNRSAAVRECYGRIHDANGHEDEADVQHVEFAAPFYSCLESDGTVTLNVMRSGPDDELLKVNWKTRDGTAVSPEDFIAAEGELVFKPGEHTQQIDIVIIDDDRHEPDEDFFIDLSEPTSAGKCRLGDVRTAVVTIIDDDEPGVLSFAEDDFYVKEDEKCATIWVMRKDGCSADVSCSYRTEDGTAIAGRDYKESSGTVTLAKGEVRKSIEIPVLNDVSYSKNVAFRFIIDM